jgi:hypothetical protein
LAMSLTMIVNESLMNLSANVLLNWCSRSTLIVERSLFDKPIVYTIKVSVITVGIFHR